MPKTERQTWLDDEYRWVDSYCIIAELPYVTTFPPREGIEVRIINCNTPVTLKDKIRK